MSIEPFTPTNILFIIKEKTRYRKMIKTLFPN